MAVVPKFVGERIKRREDPRLITGQATYVDDLKLVGMLSMVVVRSPHAHARLKAVRLDKARRAPGVVAVLSAEEIEGQIGTLPCGAPATHVPVHPVLAKGKVRFVGEPVAVVVADSVYRAQDAAELVEVDYEPLPAVIDMEKALSPGAPLVHEEFGTNLCHKVETPTAPFEEAALKADKVIEFRLVNQRLIPTPMEPRAAAAKWDAGMGQLTLWSSTQIPHMLRSLLCGMLQLGESKMRVIAPEVGGGFGCKLNVYPEEALVGYLARKLNRPVKWAGRRREDMAATTHGRDHVTYVKIAAKRDGTVLGVHGHFICGMGAYLHLLTPLVPGLSTLMMTGCYKIGAASFTEEMVFTNKMATDAYRGAGRPEATYMIERVMDMVASEFGLDPAEVRRKNFIPKDAFPYTTATGLVYDSGNYEPALDKALALADYRKLRAEQAAARKQGRYIGIGVSTYVEICGIGPSAILPMGRGWESGTVRVEPDCKITVLTGSSPHGQGEETSFAQLAADAFGINIDDVTVIHGDTAIVQYGIGTFGSRTLALGGAALMMSVEKVQAKMRKIASTMMEVPPEQLVFHQGTIALASDHSKAIPMAQVVEAAYGYKQPIAGVEPGLTETSFYEPVNCTYPFGTHIAVVEVDVATGQVKFLRYVAVDDCGRVINPLLVEGQVQGGIAQSIGQALYEEAVYDEQSGQLLSGTLMDYALPKADVLPHFELAGTVTPSPHNPLGVKGIGEAGTIGATPCVVNAVVDALAPFGIRHLDMPLKPEKIWRAVKAAQAKA